MTALGKHWIQPGYRALWVLAFRTDPGARNMMAGRIIFYGVLLLVYTRLWRAIFDSSGPIGSMSPEDCVWYLAITEWITLSLPRNFEDIEQEVRSGEVASQLLRPMNYAGSKVALGLGEVAVRLCVLAPVGVLLAYGLTGQWPTMPQNLWLAAPVGVLAALLLLLFHVLIGMSAFWFNDVSPTSWIYQKISFITGGVLLPLDIYPDWLRELAQYSPFAVVYYQVARLALGYPSTSLVSLTTTLLTWIGLALVFLYLIQVRAMTRVQLHGG